PGCLSIRLLGTNPTGLYITGTVLYGLTAFGWYALLRKAFALPAWLAFAAGTIFLSYPDFGSQYIASSQLRIAGSAALITSTWAILTFWEKPRRWGWLVLGFGLALLGLLTYEVLLGLWIVGLPLMLLYKDRRITWRWAIATTGIIALVAAYLVWRLVLLPRTYTATTILAGGGASTIFLDPLNVLRQLAPLYVLVYQNLRSAIDLTIGVLASAEGGRLLALSLLAVGLAALILWRIGKRESPSLTSAVGRSLRESRTLFFAFWIAVPILALPFLFSTIATLRVG
ncbi:MAG TPA: hypothetical protein VMT34_18800, partial [Aggregatilineales bacterium]|nr:hypothetical protein [Aggregatilineales bacterium]